MEKNIDSREIAISWEDFSSRNKSTHSLTTNEGGFTIKAQIESIGKIQINDKTYLVINLHNVQKKYQAEPSRCFKQVEEVKQLLVEITSLVKVFDINGGNFYITLPRGENITLYQSKK